MIQFFKRLFYKKLILVGSRTNLTDIKVTAEDSGYKIIGILDKHYWGNTDSICGIPVIGSEEELLDTKCRWRKYSFFPANWWDGKQATNGFNADKLRQERIKLLDDSGVRVANLISNGVHWFHGRENIKLGKGILILANSSISGNTEIGDYSVVDWEVKLVNTKLGRNNIVGVDSILAHATVGDNVRMGVRSVVLPRKKPTVSIGSGSILFVNSLTLEDIPENTVQTMYRIQRKRTT